MLYFLFLSLTTPHDCFVCFNRLPNKRYSIYQYTQLERNNYREKQFGKGAVQRYKELVDRESDRQEEYLVESKMTLAKDKDGRPTPEVALEYFKYKQMMSGLLREQDQERRDQERQKEEFLAFDQREIPITDEDVFRVGGTLRAITLQTESEEDY